MKAYKITTYIVDHEGKGKKELLYHLTDSKYLSIQVGQIDEIDIGEWEDDHPLNKAGTDKEAYFAERIV